MSEPLRLEIDELRLDKEWLDQPLQFYRWSKITADAQFKLDSAKSEFALTEAEVSREIRDKPEAYGLSKVTDKAIDATVQTQPEYVAASKAVDRAKHELAIASAAVAALEQRKRALTMLVELWVREYYVDAVPRPRSEKSAEFEREAVQERIRRRTAEKESAMHEAKREDSDE